MNHLNTSRLYMTSSAVFKSFASETYKKSLIYNTHHLCNDD